MEIQKITTTIANLPKKIDSADLLKKFQPKIEKANGVIPKNLDALSVQGKVQALGFVNPKKIVDPKKLDALRAQGEAQALKFVDNLKN